MSATLDVPVLLTRGEAAEYLRIKVQTLAAWAATGRYRLPMVKVGSRVFYRKDDLDRWLRLRTRGEALADAT